MESETVLLTQEQFEDLIESTGLHVKNSTTDGSDLARLVSSTEWERLQLAALEYNQLRRNLINFGFDENAVRFMANKIPKPLGANSRGGRNSQANGSDNTIPHHVPQDFKCMTTEPHHRRTTNQNISKVPTVSRLSSEPSTRISKSGVIPLSDHETVGTAAVREEDQGHTKPCHYRSVTLKGFHAGSTLVQVSRLVRGGLILNMYMKKGGEVAHITFFKPSAAQAFIQYIGENAITIRGKRVEALWDSRQAIPSPDLVQKILKDGATRNLLVVDPRRQVNARKIRKDLEHIHQLHVVKIINLSEGILVSLNAVGIAVTARTCLRSRFEYQGTHIAYAPDECAQEIEQQQQVFAEVEQTQGQFRNLDIEDIGWYDNEDDENNSDIENLLDIHSKLDWNGCN